MRCKRCHAVIEKGRKTCPNCGTLVRKRRGNIKLSAESGVSTNRFSDMISDLTYRLSNAIKRDKRILPVIVAVPLILIGTIILISSCDSCACTCKSCSEKESGSASGVLFDSRVPMKQSVYADELYYIDSENSCIMRRGSDESYSRVCIDVSATSISATKDGVYYSDGERIYNIPDDFVPVSGSDKGKIIVDCADDPMFKLGGFFSGGDVLFYIKNESGSGAASVYSYDAETGAASLVLSGSVSDLGYMNGRVYFCRENEEGRGLFCVAADGSDERNVADNVIDYQLGKGHVYLTRADEEGKIMLSRCTGDGKEECVWDIEAVTGASLSGFGANDDWLCILTSSADGSSVYRVEHDGTDLKRIGFFSNEVELTGVSGSWYAMKYSTEEKSGYMVRDSLTDKTAVK